MTETIEKEYYGVNSPMLAINDMRGNGVFKIPDAPEGVLYTRYGMWENGRVQSRTVDKRGPNLVPTD